LGGEHTHQPMHAGLVCINSEMPPDLDLQLDLFGIALDVLEAEADLVNKVLDLNHGVDGQVEYDIYDIPEPQNAPDAAAQPGLSAVQAPQQDAAAGAGESAAA